MVKGDRIVGIDIGTTKICTIVAEVDDQGGLKITGVGSAPSEGLKRGVVINVEKTVKSIQEAIDRAEQMSDTRITAVYAGIAGSHVRGLNQDGVAAISTREVADEDVRRVLDQAKA
ncbi:cell division protein FtsA, partial [bacterium]|nr:cell division protein FtsA [bacterium]